MKRSAGSFGPGEKKATGCGSSFRRSPDLGQSPTSVRFAISSLEEASAYLAHPVLGPRVRNARRLRSLLKERPLAEIFGPVDEMKFRSSMTLFATAAPTNSVFRRCLEKYFRRRARPRDRRKI